MRLHINKLWRLRTFDILVNKLSFFTDNEKMSMLKSNKDFIFLEKEGSCFGESICNDFIGEM